MNENDGWDPFPANIEVDPTDANNHVFVVHGQLAATTEGRSFCMGQPVLDSVSKAVEGQATRLRFTSVTEQIVMV